MTILMHQARPVHSGGKQIPKSTSSDTPSTHHGRAASGSAAAHGGAVGAALGTITKSRAAGDAMARRVERYALQAVARDILPKSRTALCLRTRKEPA